jgi:hypothetical protein
LKKILEYFYAHLHYPLAQRWMKNKMGSQIMLDLMPPLIRATSSYITGSDICRGKADEDMYMFFHSVALSLFFSLIVFLKRFITSELSAKKESYLTSGRPIYWKKGNMRLMPTS